MNPSSSFWNNPPPPGTECDVLTGEEHSNSIAKKDISTSSGKIFDKIEPIVKSRDNVEYEKIKHRSRSRSYERHRKKRSHSKSRDHHRSSYSSRKRRRSRSRSRSFSRGRHRHRSHERRHRHSSRFSHSRSRSKSKSRSHKSYKSRSERSKKSESRRGHSKHKTEEHLANNDTKVVDMILEEEDDDEDEPEPTKENAFKNDGSFLETFKKLQEKQQQEAEQKNMEMKKTLPSFGKRRGGKVLKTGIVQKSKVTNEELTSAQDAWSVYMKEVQRYKEACCDDSSKTTPLTK